MKRIFAIVLCLVVVTAVAAQEPERAAGPAASGAPAGTPETALPPDVDPALRKDLPRRVHAPTNSIAYHKILRALDEEARFDYLDQPLRDVVEDIAFRFDIPILLDAAAMEDAGIGPDEPITLQLKGLSLRASLRLLLKQADLTFILRQETLQITTPEAAEQHAQISIYPVGALLPADRSGEWLVELVTRVVAPDRWEATGGRGTLTFVKHFEVLVVRQSDDVLEEVDSLLHTLRELPRD